jgi:3-deoxy-D-manno-octulosonate 8-phosphate phosphatase (KDO 8-P phosphatase)
MVIEKAKKIKLLILDVDGVMTDGRIILGDDGKELKFFDVKDGHGIKLAHQAGLTTAIISGRESRLVSFRAKELGIKIVYQNIHDKSGICEEIMKEKGFSHDEVAYIGDDIVDLSIMNKVGLSIAVADALPYVKDAADLVTAERGGRGAVREAIEFILKAQGRWERLFEEYSGRYYDRK